MQSATFSSNATLFQSLRNSSRKNRRNDMKIANLLVVIIGILLSVAIGYQVILLISAHMATIFNNNESYKISDDGLSPMSIASWKYPAVEKNNLLCWTWMVSNGTVLVQCKDITTGIFTPQYSVGISKNEEHRDATIWIDRYGNIYVAWDCCDFNGLKISKSKRIYNPSEWDIVSTFNKTSDLIIYPEIRELSNGILILFSTNSNTEYQTQANLTIRFSSDNATTWSSPTTIIAEAQPNYTGNYVYANNIVVKDDKFYISYIYVDHTSNDRYVGPWFAMFNGTYLTTENENILSIPFNHTSLTNIEPVDNISFTNVWDFGVTPSGNYLISYSRNSSGKYLDKIAIWNKTAWNTYTVYDNENFFPDSNRDISSLYIKNDSTFYYYISPFNSFGFYSIKEFESTDSGVSWHLFKDIADFNSTNAYAPISIYGINGILYQTGFMDSSPSISVYLER